jgi:hypothetical protein
MNRSETLLGYDCRERWCPRERLWPPGRTEGFLLRTDVEKPLSTDVFVWPSVFEDQQLGLLELDDLDLGPAGLHTPAWRGWVQDLWQDLATLRAAAAPRLERGFDVIAVTSSAPWHFDVPECVPATLGDQWSLLGFDVVDGWLLSGLTNCGYLRDEIEAQRSRWAPHLNAHHLFDDEAQASEFAKLADLRVREHAPFYICALWRLTSA